MKEQEASEFAKMEANVGKECGFLCGDGSRISGAICGVPNSEHYCVGVPMNGYTWDWYVRKEHLEIAEL
jgi:hypothetical protein